MMKRFLLVCSILIAAVISVFAATYSSDLSRAIQLQGAYREVVSLDFEEIAAQTQAYLIGMPFNIQDQTVQSSAGEGRVISRWNIITNTPFTLRLSSEGMFHEDDLVAKDNALHFNLKFSYNLSYYIDGVAKSSEASFTYDSNNVTMDGISLVPAGAVPDSSTFIGSVDGLVYFKFVTSSSDIDDDTTYPPGKYYADVKVEVITE